MSDIDTSTVERWTVLRDAEAFRTIVMRHSAMVYAICRRILGNASDAEDATQECSESLAQASRPPSVGLLALYGIPSFPRSDRASVAYSRKHAPCWSVTTRGNHAASL